MHINVPGTFIQCYFMIKPYFDEKTAQEIFTISFQGTININNTVNYPIFFSLLMF